MVSSTQRFRDNLSRVFATARRGTDGDDGDGGVSLFPRTRNEFPAVFAGERRRDLRRRLKYLRFSAADAVRLSRISVLVRILVHFARDAAPCLLAYSAGIVLLNRFQDSRRL